MKKIQLNKKIDLFIIKEDVILMSNSDTVQWWNKEFENTEFSQIPTSCPSIPQATLIWTQISPIILANVDESDDTEYWKKVQLISAKVTGNENVPNPKDNISIFLDFFYSNHDLFKPTLPQHCLSFIEAFCPTPCNDFFVFNFPRSINNPMLALRTYQYMQNTRNKKWRQFISENGAIGRLMDFYLPFLTPLLGQYDPIHWQYRLELCDLIVTLVKAHYDNIPLVDEFIVSLNRQITLILSDAPPEIAADFVRFAIEVCQISLPRIRPETASKRLLNYLNAAPPGSSAHSALVRYAFKKASDFITPDSLISSLMKQGVTCSYDLEIITQIACNPKSTPSSQLLAARQLACHLTLDPFYGRTSGKLFAKLLPKLKEPEANDQSSTVNSTPQNSATKSTPKPSTNNTSTQPTSGDENNQTPAETPDQTTPISAKEWIIKFIRRVIVFVALANAKNKYKGRIAQIAEILSNPELKAIDWFNSEVNRNVSAMIKMNLHPAYYSKIFELVEVPEDDKWKDDYELFDKEHVTLKRFPFGASGSNLFDNEKPKGKKKKKKNDDANNNEGDNGTEPAKETKKKASKKAKDKAGVTPAPTEANPDAAGEAAPKKKVRRPKWKA